MTDVNGTEIDCDEILFPAGDERRLLNVMYRYYIVNSGVGAVMEGMERDHRGETLDLYKEFCPRQRYMYSGSVWSLQEVIVLYLCMGE